MKKVYVLIILVAAIGFSQSCKKEKSPGSSIQDQTIDYPLLPTTVDTYYPNADGANKIATLGRALFYDKHLSLNNSVSCGSCHKQAYGFADNAAFSRGFDNRNTMRNSLSIENLGGASLKEPTKPVSATLFWDGRENIVNNLIARPITNHVEMGIADFSALSGKLSSLPYYSGLFKSAFGTDEITIDRISLAITYFMCAIKVTHTRFDDSTVSLTALELEGEQLFMTKYQCASCHHIDPNGYANGAPIVNIGLDMSSADLGYGVISGSPSFDGSFRVPNLRNVALTAPYMHDGRFKTLDDVLDFYSHGIQNTTNLSWILKDTSGQVLRMNISAQEKTALKAFLNTLTDFDMITDPKLSDPFKIKS